MLDEHGGVVDDHEAAQRKAEKYGSGDPVLPYAIGGAVIIVALIAMHTVGHKVVPISTTLALVLDGLWLVAGLWLIIIWPIILWIPEDRPHKWLKFYASIIAGIVYFVVSFVLMATVGG